MGGLVRRREEREANRGEEALAWIAWPRGDAFSGDDRDNTPDDDDDDEDDDEKTMKMMTTMTR